ncbi:MAG TPA: hypothetical protein ENH82_17545 [bacterium]|nr:hypothetical protein [bacterium]
MRFVKNEFQMGKISMMAGDYSTGLKSYAAGVGLGLFATPKTILQLAKPYGMIEIMMWDKVSQPTK